MATFLSLTEVKLAWGDVRHQRMQPKPNGFAIGACYIRLVFTPTNQPITPKTMAGLAIDRKGLVSVQATSYGFQTHTQQFPAFVQQLKTEIEQKTGLSLNGEVHLQTFPKVMGFVFNPVSFWCFHDSENICVAILCEVNNTFGERHFYLLQTNQHTAIDKGMLLHASKAFHVSPFFPVKGRYEFRFMNKNERTLARINYFENEALNLSTSISGRLQTPTKKLWFKTMLRYGWFTVMVFIKIHWQAIKLFTKGATFHKKPPPPDQQISHNKNEV